MPTHPAPLRSGLPAGVRAASEVPPRLGAHVHAQPGRTARGGCFWGWHGDQDEQQRDRKWQRVSQRGPSCVCHHLIGAALCLSAVHVGAKRQSGSHVGCSNSGPETAADQAAQPQIQQSPNPRRVVLVNPSPAACPIPLLFPSQDVCSWGDRWLHCGSRRYRWWEQRR